MEKILKAVLTENEVEFSRTHNILDLQNAVKKLGHELPIDIDDAVFLNSVYRSRYPAALGLLPTGEPIKEDAERALGIMRKMRVWMRDIFAD